MSKLNVLVCGSTGYIGIELVKILAKHKKIHIKYLCGNSSVGKNISFYDKSLSKKKLPIIRKFQRKLLKEVDVIFSALPNGEAQKLSKFLLDKNLLIDLSADFRLKNKNEYLKWYKIKHSAQKLIQNSIYFTISIHSFNKSFTTHRRLRYNSRERERPPTVKREFS